MADDLLKKLGLELEFEENVAKVYDDKGALVARFPFDTQDQPYSNIRTITPTDSKVVSKYQGKGVASEVYKKAEDHFGAKIIPDDEQSFQGNLLHEKKGLGKDFGLSSNELDSMLTKTEKKHRHARQRALQEIGEEIAEGKYGDGIEALSKFGNARRSVRELSEKIRKNAPSRNTVSLLNHVVSSNWDDALQKLNLEGIREALPKVISRVKSIAPVLTGGAGLLASAASEAADTESTGDAPEQAALLREIDERKRREKNLAASPGIRMAAEKMYEEADSGKMFDARRDALRNLVRK